MRKITLLPLLLIACVPDWVEIKPTDDNQDSSDEVGEIQDEEYDTAEPDFNNESTDPDNSSDPDSNSDGSSGSDSTADTVIESGIWVPHSVNIVEDPCDWISQIPNFFASVEEANAFYIEQLFPYSFDVVGFERSFDIEARNYGARGAIECETDGADFTCELQTVDSHNQYFYGFTYFIEFNGTVVNSQYLEGHATVSFGLAENDHWWYDFLQNYDVSVSECTQVYDLSLQYH